MRRNAGGLPIALADGIRALSGIDVSDVRVRHGSSEPAQLGAHAFARGAEIHLASGQARHLPHEAWHVVQQRQGRVPVTAHVGGVAINDDPRLEQEADRMGRLAAAHQAPAPAEQAPTAQAARLVQRRAVTQLRPGWLARLAGLARLPSRPANQPASIARLPQKTTLYRADSRRLPPEGFKRKSVVPHPPAVSRPTREQLSKYMKSNAENPGVVSTAETLDGAETFAHQRSLVFPQDKMFIYEIDASDLAHAPSSENIPWWVRFFYAEQREIMIVEDIAADRIKLLKEFNPNDFVPPSGFD